MSMCRSRSSSVEGLGAFKVTGTKSAASITTSRRLAARIISQSCCSAARISTRSSLAQECCCVTTVEYCQCHESRFQNFIGCRTKKGFAWSMALGGLATTASGRASISELSVSRSACSTGALTRLSTGDLGVIYLSRRVKSVVSTNNLHTQMFPRITQHPFGPK